jgi:hypothetical protein
MGFGASGLEVNSGWNWVPIKNGCPGISTISISFPFGETPENTNPFSVKGFIYLGFTS